MRQQGQGLLIFAWVRGSGFVLNSAWEIAQMPL